MAKERKPVMARAEGGAVQLCKRQNSFMCEKADSGGALPDLNTGPSNNEIYPMVRLFNLPGFNFFI